MLHSLSFTRAVLGSTWLGRAMRALVCLAFVTGLQDPRPAKAQQWEESLEPMAIAEDSGAFQVPDFYIFCRLAARTELVGTYSTNVATLGSDTVIPMEALIAGSGFISLQGYIAEARNNPTVKSDRGALTTLSESVLLSQASLNSPRLLGLVRPNQAFRILATIKGPDGGEPALFHKVEIKGRLVDPVFNQCSPNSGY